MASVIKEPNGGRMIQFALAGGRRTVRLGKVTQKAADEIKRRIELICNAQMANTSLDDETAKWLAGINEIMAEKMAAVGLIPERVKAAAAKAATLGEFIDAYVLSRTDAKPGTKTNWRQGKTSLLAFFSADRPLQDVTPGDADEYKVALTTRKAKIGTDRKLSSQQANKLLRFAKLIFRAAKRKRLISESPFEEVSIKLGDTENDHFVSHEDTYKLIAACSNFTWRAIVALARFGGLRCPSEVLSLRWQDVDWETDKIVVQSPKTEHHPGKATRVIPLFPELRPYLQEAFENAPDGAICVVSDEMRQRANGPDGWVNVNLRTSMQKIVTRSGLAPWKRLFHNLRASRQTELEDKFPTHVVCKWLGNSPKTARKHYLKVTDEHFAAALQGAAKSEAPALQKAQQSAAVTKSKGGKKSPQLIAVQGVLPSVTESDSLILYNNVAEAGLEPALP
ncbi:MAG: site-specific integrase [Pirellulaceae bacterium]|nr:site-specific integrase [Pirellulaceae bacterium]